MRLFNQFDPSILSGVLNTGGINTNEQLMMYNDSLYGLQLTFADNSIDVIPPSWNKDFILANIPMGQVKWSVYNQIIASNYPMKQVYGTLYEPGEHVARVNAGMQRGFQITGGVIAVNNNTLSNEGNAINTQVIDIGTVANPSLWLIDNDHFAISIEVGGVKHVVLTGSITGNPLQLGQGGDITEILGSGQIDGNLTVAGSSGLVVSSGPIQTTGVGQNIQASGQINSVTGIISLHSHNCLDFSGANFSLLVPTGANIQAQVNGSAKLVIDSGNVTVSAGLLANNGATISGGSFSCSSGSSFSSGLTVTGNSLFITQGSIKRTTHGSFTTNNTTNQNVAHGMSTDTPDEVIIWCAGSTSTTTASVVSIGPVNFVLTSFGSVTMHFEARKY